MTRRPQLRDQNVLIPSIGGSKCPAGHFWSHELVDLMVWSPQFGDQNDAKATAAGSECFAPQHWGIKIVAHATFEHWSNPSFAKAAHRPNTPWRSRNYVLAEAGRSKTMCKWVLRPAVLEHLNHDTGQSFDIDSISFKTQQWIYWWWNTEYCAHQFATQYHCIATLLSSRLSSTY